MTICPRCLKPIEAHQAYANVRYGEGVLSVHDLPGCLSTDDEVLSMGVQLPE